MLLLLRALRIDWYRDDRLRSPVPAETKREFLKCCSCYFEHAAVILNYAAFLTDGAIGVLLVTMVKLLTCEFSYRENKVKLEILDLLESPEQQ